jgi:hypothetical protein
MVMILTALQQLLADCLTAPLASKEEMEAETVKRPSVLARLKKRSKPTLLASPPRTPRQPTEGIRQSDLLEAMKQPHTPARTGEMSRSFRQLNPTRHLPAHEDRLYKYESGLPALLMIGNAVHTGMEDCGSIPCHVKVSEQNFEEFYRNTGNNREYFVVQPSGFVYVVKVWPDPVLTNQSVFCNWRTQQWAM